MKIHVLLLLVFVIILFCICIFCIFRRRFRVDHYKNSIKIIYVDNADWEIDYVMTEICQPFDIKPILIKKDELLNNNLTTKYSNIINNNILVFNHHISYDSIEKVIKNIKPKIIIYLSDEYGIYEKYLELSKYVKLFLRQYTFKKYNIQNYNNVMQIPLGYMNGMFNKQYALDLKKEPIQNRKYIWSFIGNIKADRQEMVNTFKNTFKTASGEKPILALSQRAFIFLIYILSRV